MITRTTSTAPAAPLQWPQRWRDSSSKGQQQQIQWVPKQQPEVTIAIRTAAITLSRTTAKQKKKRNLSMTMINKHENAIRAAGAPRNHWWHKIELQPAVALPWKPGSKAEYAASVWVKLFVGSMALAQKPSLHLSFFIGELCLKMTWLLWRPNGFQTLGAPRWAETP